MRGEKRAHPVPASKVSREEAFALYLAMGAQRSLGGLRDKLGTESGRKPPSHDTLSRWSAEDEWVARAKARDQEVAMQAIATANTAAADRLANAYEDRSVTFAEGAARPRTLIHDPKAGLGEVARVTFESIKVVAARLGGPPASVNRAHAAAADAADTAWLKQAEAFVAARVRAVAKAKGIS